MDEAKFRRLRLIILDSTTIDNEGILFDTNIALEKGYPEEEIAVADELLTNCSFFTRDFLDKIRYWYGDPDFKPQIYFVEFAKIIFIIDKNKKKPIHIFEEELEKEVFFKEYITTCRYYIGNTLTPGSYGE